jgi:ribosomal protein L11 methyltransferase
MQWVELAFSVEPERAEELMVALVEAGAAGVEERDERTTFEKAPPGRMLLVVWVDPREVEPFLARARGAGLSGDVARRDRDEDEWRDAWKKFFGPRLVGKFLIMPSWVASYDGPAGIAIHMDPGRAFGTGAHASTRLCLQAVSAVERRAVPRRRLRLGRAVDRLRPSLPERHRGRRRHRPRLRRRLT